MPVEGKKEAKRKRAPNWHDCEKSLLLSVVEENISIVENKKTDGTSLRQKSEAWDKATLSFNAATSKFHRSAANLKQEWECLKKAAKKDLSIRRSNANQTGGGPPIPPSNKLFGKILTLIGAAAVGYCSPYDCDAERIEPIPAIGVTESLVDPPVMPMEVCMQEPNDHHQLNPVSDGSSYLPNMLQTPVSSQLVDETIVVEKEAEEHERNTTKHSSRRGPVLPKSSLERLHEEQILSLKLARQHAIEEWEEKRNMQIIEMKIKKQQLRKETEEREERKKMQIIETKIKEEQLRQEKIKTQILLKRKRRQ